MVSFKRTGDEVLFERSHQRISSTDSKVRTKLFVSIIDFGTLFSADIEGVESVYVLFRMKS